MNSVTATLKSLFGSEFGSVIVNEELSSKTKSNQLVSGQSGSEQSSLACHQQIYNNLIHFSAKFKGKTSSCILVNTVLQLLCLPIYIHVPQELQSRGSCNFMSFTKKKNHQGMLIYLIMHSFCHYFIQRLTHVLLCT